MSVLIIKMGALGDLIMATPAIRNIVNHHAGTPVWLLTSPPYTHLFNDWSGLSVKGLPRRGFSAMLNTLSWIRRQRFQRLYDLQSSERTAIISLLSGIPERAGNHPGIAYTTHPPERYTGQCHALERLYQILTSAGLALSPGRPWLPVNEMVKAKVRDWLAQHGLAAGDFVLMHAGASAKHAHKRWPYFSGLALELKRLGLETVWLGGPDDVVLNTVLAGQTGLDSTGQFSVSEEIELGRHARFAVTNDSAPMHILSCSGIPVFGLFGPTDWVRTHAVGQQDNIITAEGPVAGGRRFSPHPIENISVEYVMRRLRQSGLLA